MNKESLNYDALIDILKTSHSLIEASQAIYKSSEDKYKQRIRLYCQKNNIDYNGLFLPKEEKHYYCKCCGKEILGPNKSQKQFCNHSCSASFNNSGRLHTAEEKIKISQTMQRNNPEFKGIYKDIKSVQRNNYAILPNQGKIYYCVNCNKTLVKKANKYCSKQCQKDYQYKQYISRWRQGLENGITSEYGISKYIRRYFFEKNNNSCECCGWNQINPYTGQIPLQLHHKDGNCLNNTEENLMLLCPNCHSLTENFGSRNKNSPIGRSKYYHKN